MSVANQVSLDEYLNTSYEPDCDYVDGELLERNAGKFDHSRIQALFIILLGARERQGGFRVLPEQRIQVAPRRVRIPDVCLLLDAQRAEQVINVPPFLCIEILSPDDSMSGMQERIDEYLAFGVPYVWIIDPRRARSYLVTREAMTEARDGILRTSKPEISVSVDELFAGLR